MDIASPVAKAAKKPVYGRKAAGRMGNNDFEWAFFRWNVLSLQHASGEIRSCKETYCRLFLEFKSPNLKERRRTSGEECSLLFLEKGNGRSCVVADTAADAFTISGEQRGALFLPFILQGVWRYLILRGGMDLLHVFLFFPLRFLTVDLDCGYFHTAPNFRNYKIFHCPLSWKTELDITRLSWSTNWVDIFISK